MKKSVIAALLAVLFVPLRASETTPVESKISNVTVYMQGAIVTRQASANLQAGQHALLLRGIPQGLTKEAIRVKTSSSARMLEIDYRMLTPEERGQQSMEGQNKKLKDLRTELAKTIKLLEARKTDLDFINTKNRLFEKSDSPTAQQLREMDVYLSKRREELLMEILRLQEVREKQQQNMQKVVGEIQTLTNQNLESEQGLVVKVDVSRAGKVALEVEYFTADAGWTPVYNIRANNLDQPLEIEMTAQIDQFTGEEWQNVYLSLSTGNPVLSGSIPEMMKWELRRGQGYVPLKRIEPIAHRRGGTGSFFGYVTESSTGQAVPYANVVVTSGNVIKNAVADLDGKVRLDDLPEGRYTLHVSAMGHKSYNASEYIRRGQTTNLRISLEADENVLEEVEIRKLKTVASHSAGVNQKDEGRSLSFRGARSDGDVQFIDGVKVSGNMQENFERAEQFTTEVYSIDKPYTIPADGMPRTVWVNTSTIKADFIHRVRPALDDDAFLLAHITEWEKLRLQKGKALLFLEGTYMGDTYLDPSNTGDTLTLSVGRDKQVAVKRTRIKSKTSRSFFGSNEREVFSYKIEIRNNKKIAVKLEVEDQIPIAGDKEISVDKVEISKSENAKVNTDKGFITWTLDLPASAREELTFGFQVSYPKDWKINLPR